eukprot:COSAG01_NODE_2574_length_7434_cov_6.745467_4_plen_257_part_00
MCAHHGRQPCVCQRSREPGPPGCLARRSAAEVGRRSAAAEWSAGPADPAVAEELLLPPTAEQPGWRRRRERVRETTAPRRFLGPMAETDQPAARAEMTQQTGRGGAWRSPGPRRRRWQTQQPYPAEDPANQRGQQLRSLGSIGRAVGTRRRDGCRSGLELLREESSARWMIHRCAGAPVQGGTAAAAQGGECSMRIQVWMSAHAKRTGDWRSVRDRCRSRHHVVSRPSIEFRRWSGSAEAPPPGDAVPEADNGVGT